MWHAWVRQEVYKVVVVKPEGKRPLQRPGRAWKDGIKMDIKENGWWGGGGVEWLHVAQDGVWWRAVVNTLLNRRVLEPRK